MENIVSLIDNPLVDFTILLLVILTIPPLFERLKLPGLVGLLFAGVVLGSNGLDILDAKSETMKLFSDIGKIYLMFVAGLEIDLLEFRKTKNRSLGFGFATFLLPLLTGSLVGHMFGFNWNSAFLIGSLLASHTLLGYPIVNRLGVVRNEAVTVTIGATIFTDIASLLILAICVSIHSGEFSAVNLVIQLVMLALYTAAVLFGLDWAGKEYFRRSGDEESNQFLFVLLSVFLAAVGAQIINVDQIVGAFLAGLAVNDVVGHGPVEEKVVFVGSTLFIPFFFVGMGLLIDIPAFIDTVQSHLPLMLGIVGGLIVSKLVAAMFAKLLYRYSIKEALTMWSLSLPQVAATLAAALAGYEAINPQGERLINEPVFNSVIVLMLVTSVLGPILTAQFARNLPLPNTKLQNNSQDWETNPENTFSYPQEITDSQPFTVVVPIYNPHTGRYLIEVAGMISRHESGIIVPLSITKAYVHMDDPILTGAIKQSQRLINRAMDISEELGIKSQGKIRIDDDISHGISRIAREENASLIIMGWGETTGFRARLFGNVIDNVFWSTHCPVAVMRLLDEPVNIRRLLVPVKIINAQNIRTIKFAQLFAQANQGDITLLHVCDRGTSLEDRNAFEEELTKVVNQMEFKVNYQIKTLVEDDVARAIITMTQDFDLLIVRSMRRRSAGGLAVSDVTTEIIKDVPCSLVMFGEPHS